MNIATLFKLLGDETRLRILHLLSQHALNVSELTAILGLAQSGVSRHLSQLKQAKLLQERKDGLWNYYQLIEKPSSDSPFYLFFQYLYEQLSLWEDSFGDRARLQEVLRLRHDAGPGLNERLLEPGQSWQTWSRALGELLPKLTVADLGCGDGTLTLEMASFAKSIVAIDRNPEYLELAQQKAHKLGHPHITWKCESLESLSLSDQSMDVAFCCQVLHHLPKPQDALNEAYRILKPGGQLILTELASHQEAWVQDQLGHTWLGFELHTLESMLQTAGFQKLSLQTMPSRKNEVFRVILISGTK